MPSVYQLKPRFLTLLAPLTARLAHRGQLRRVAKEDGVGLLIGRLPPF